MYTFKVIEKKDSDLETVIEKGGLTTTFTIQDVLDHLEYTEKTLRQTKAQLEAEDMQNTLAEETLPILKELPEDKWQLIIAYASRKNQRPLSVSLIETAEKTIESYKAQLEQIKNDLGLSIEPVVEEIKEESKEEVVVE